VPSEEIKVMFHGGGEEVGNVALYLEDHTGTNVVIDYGMVPSDPPRYPSMIKNIQNAILTHVHLDHVALAPWLASTWGTQLHCTPFTASTCELIWRDTHKIARIEKHPLIWDLHDLDEGLRMLRPTPLLEWQDLGEWKWRFHDAGHIVGAAMVEIDMKHTRILITGDYDTRATPTTNAAVPIEADIVFTEGTYGGRNHALRSETEERFLAAIERVIDRGGQVLVPAFAIGRSQDILRLLERSNKNLEIHFDGMGRKVTELMLQHPNEVVDSNGLQAMYQRSRRVTSKTDRKKAIERADVILTTSGMLNGGPALWYLNRLQDDPRSAVFLTGFQVPGSGGHSLLEKGSIPIWGKDVSIACEVDLFPLSTHAGHDEIVEFVEATGARDVVIYHSDAQHSQPALVNALATSERRVHTQKNDVHFTLPITNSSSES